jgi:hypothetical protein
MVANARAADPEQRVGCVNSIEWAETTDLHAEPTLRSPQAGVRLPGRLPARVNSRGRI